MNLIVADLALRSALNRRATLLLTVLAIAIGVGAFLAVEKVRSGARDAFERTISGTDLIVGTRTGSINLMLFTVFHIGEVPANMTWESFERIAGYPEVDWAVPISLGDSFRNYRVVGTTPAFLDHYRYGDDRPLALADGVWPQDTFGAVLGADVAATLDLGLDAPLTLSHGLRSADFSAHENTPFRVSGVLRATGTPVDRTVFVGLDGIEAMHFGWRSGAPTPMARLATPERIAQMDLSPDSITAAYLGLTSPISVLQVQRRINTDPQEPLMAALPGVSLSRLWEVVGATERVMIVMTVLIVVVGLVSILVSLLATLGERRREIAVLRAVGAKPRDVFLLLMGEAGIVALAGALVGVVLVQLATSVISPLMATRFGLTLTAQAPGLKDLYTVVAVALIGVGLGTLPGALAYRRALSEGLTVRI
ncbi:MAG: FtsX-like permease family protein [Pseudomonadota bacterium]